MLRTLIAAVCTGAVTLATAVPAHSEPPALRDVTYTVTTAIPVSADIYFRDVEPPNWADYSHNPYMFSPKVSVELGPDRPWVRRAALADPDRWAMVSATSGRQPVDAMFRCELAVDGVVVATAEGAKGALCALRHW